MNIQETAVATAKELLQIDQKSAQAGIEAAKVKLAAAEAERKAAPKMEAGPANNKVLAAQKELEEETKKLADANRRAVLGPIEEEIILMGKVRRLEMQNIDARKDAEADLAADKEQAALDRAAQDKELAEEDHLLKMANLAAEKQARVNELLKTPEEKRREADQARKEKRAVATVKSHERDHAATQERNRGGQIPIAEMLRKAGDAAFKGDTKPRQGGNFIGPQLPIGTERGARLDLAPHHARNVDLGPRNHNTVQTPAPPHPTITPEQMTQAFDNSKLAHDISHIANGIAFTA